MIACTEMENASNFHCSQKQDFDEFNPLSKVSSCALVQIVRNQENTAPIA